MSNTFADRARCFCREFLAVAPEHRAILGVNEFARGLAEKLEVGAFIDDFAAPGEFQGLPILTRDQVDPRCLVVSCAIHGHPVTVNKLLTVGDHRNLDYFAFIRFSGLDLPPIPYWSGFEQDIEEHRQAYRRLRKRLADAESVETFDRLIEFRLCRDLSVMSYFGFRVEQQYFEDFLNLESDGEVFVDAGGFDGQSALEFVKRCPGYERVYAVEPDAANLVEVKKALSHLARVRFLEAGLWDELTELRFASQGSASSITDEGDKVIQVDCLDNLTQGRVTFVKMDIEGAERRAILGAKQTILNNHPKLAICVYHRGDDFRVIPETVLKIRDDYDIYLRHYTEGFTETVMYFIPSRSR